MTSRLIPPALTETVRSALQDEQDRAASATRPRGRAGIRHDRTLSYLTLMLEHTGTTPEDGRAAQVGDLVSVRFDGDVEHRTYRLTGDNDTDAADSSGSQFILTLPSAWPLGHALLGGRAGDTVTYSHDGSSDVAVTIIAIWDATGDAHLLPESDTYA